MDKNLTLEEAVERLIELEEEAKQMVAEKKAKGEDLDSEFMKHLMGVTMPLVEYEQVILGRLKRAGAIGNVKNPEVRAVLHRLSEKIDSEVEKELQNDDFEFDSEDEWNDDAWDFVFSQGGPKEQYLNYLRISPILTSTDVPTRIVELMEEARSCFANGRMIAVIALGRMILEVAITDIGERKGLISREQSLKDSYRFYPPPPSKVADKLLGKKGSPRREKFRKLYDEGSAEIHSKSGAGVGPLNYITRVVEFVNNEYAINLRG